MVDSIVRIRAPIWKTRSVGIAEYALRNDFTDVFIEYRDKNEKLLYPYHYRMKTTRIRTYPTKYTHGVLLYIVPIADLDVIGERW